MTFFVFFFAGGFRFAVGFFVRVVAFAGIRKMYNMVMRLRVVLLGALIACGPTDGAKGDKGDPGPQGPPGAQGSAATGQVIEVLGTGQLAVTAGTNFTLVPGLSISVTVPANARVQVETDGGIQCSQAGTAFSVVDIALFVDNTISNQAGSRRVVAANTPSIGQTIANWSFGRSLSLSAGNHEIEVRAAAVDPNAAVANVSSGTAPQLQGRLSVTVLSL